MPKRSPVLLLLIVPLAVPLVGATACGPAGDGAADRPAAAPSVVPAPEGSPLVPFATTGDLFVLDRGCSCVLRIGPAGDVGIAVEKEAITAVTGGSEVSFVDMGIAFDAAGTLYFGESESMSILRQVRGGPLEMLVSNADVTAFTSAEDADLAGLAFGEDGALYVVEDDADVVLRVDPADGTVGVQVLQEAMRTGGLEAVELDCGIVGGTGVTVYVAHEGVPPALLAIEGDTSRVVAVGEPFGELNGYMTRGRDGSVLIADAERDAVRRITSDGAVETLVNEFVLERVLGDDVRLYGGIAMDSAGSLYLVEDREDVLLKFDAELNGEIWIRKRDIRAVTDADPDLDSGIAFEPR